MEVMYDTPDFIQLTTPGANDILVFEKGTPNPGTGGIIHFGFRLKNASDIEKVVVKLKEIDATILSTGEFIAGSPYVFFLDPDGYEVEVWFEKLLP
jgi:catechol-2,3-dioxygenase